ncbi:DNA binding domain-containing protein, excisionase family [Lachnospiraceae bacterium]|nr:helix-turn-helix domain-containing protein [Eubacterium sp.]SNU05009.1 DNA binding domain-containing protein, excisionase family [Lachnospiraceae bacterium]
MYNDDISYSDDIKVYTAKDLAEILKIGRDRAYALMKSKAFPSICIGKRYIVTEKALNEWLSNYEHKRYII